jgi:hypothetical protein
MKHSKLTNPLGDKKPTHPLGTKKPAHPLAPKASHLKAPPSLPAALALAPRDQQNPGVYNA